MKKFGFQDAILVPNAEETGLKCVPTAKGTKGRCLMAPCEPQKWLSQTAAANYCFIILYKMCLGLYIILVPRADKLEFVSQTAKGTKGRCSMISDHEQKKKFTYIKYYCL